MKKKNSTKKTLNVLIKHRHTELLYLFMYLTFVISGDAIWSPSVGKQVKINLWKVNNNERIITVAIGIVTRFPRTSTFFVKNFNERNTFQIHWKSVQETSNLLRMRAIISLKRVCEADNAIAQRIVIEKFEFQPVNFHAPWKNF